MSFDPTSRQLVIFGGQTGPDGAGATLADTWALSLDGTPEWRQLHDGDVAPSARRSPAYTAGNGELLVFGGLGTETGTHHNDVWSLRVEGDNAAWTQLAADACTDANAPSCRRSTSAVLDRQRNEFVVAFGRDNQAFFEDLWRFDLATRSWRTASDICATPAVT